MLVLDNVASKQFKMKATKESPVGVMRAPRPARRKSNAAATGRRSA